MTTKTKMQEKLSRKKALYDALRDNLKRRKTTFKKQNSPDENNQKVQLKQKDHD